MQPGAVDGEDLCDDAQHAGHAEAGHEGFRQQQAEAYQETENQGQVAV